MQRKQCKYNWIFTSLLAWLFLAPFLSCKNSKQQNGKHVLDFKSFTIEVPETWKSIVLKGFDSYVGGIKAGNNDTLYFDLGRYPVRLEHYVKIIDPDQTYFLIEVGDSLIKKSDSLSMDSILNTSVRWSKVDGKKAKIIYPKTTGKGTVGIYIDSLWKLGNDKIVFTMYGNNVTKQTEEIFFESIASLKFNRK